MATIATLSARLGVDGASAYTATMEKAARKTGDLEKAALRAAHATESIGSRSTQHLQVAVRGTEALTGKMQVLGKTAYQVESATAGMGRKLTDIGRSARGLGAAFGGLGALSPVFEALSSPIGIAAVAIGALVAGIVKLKKEIAALDAMDAAGVVDGIARGAAGQAAGQKAVNAAIVAGESKAMIDALERQAAALGVLAHEEAAAAKAVQPFIDSQATLAVQIKEQESKLAPLIDKMNQLREADRAVGQEWERLRHQSESIQKVLNPLTAEFANLQNKIDATWGSTRVFANSAADAAQAVDRMKDSAKAATSPWEAFGRVLKNALFDMRAMANAMSGLGAPGRFAPPVSAFTRGAMTGIGGAMKPLPTPEVYGPAMNPAAQTAFLRNRLASRIGSVPATGLAGGVLGGASQGAAMGGPWGAAAGAAMAMLTSSKGFQSVMDALNPILQMFSDLLGSSLQAVAPLLKTVGEVLKPLMGILVTFSEIMHEMSPGMLIMKAAVSALAHIIKFVTGAIQGAMIGFLRLLKRIFGGIPGVGKALDNAIDRMRKATDAYTDATRRQVEGMTQLADGYKLLQLRIFQATNGVAPGAMLPGGAVLGGSSSSSTSAMGASGSAMSSGGGVYIEHLEVNGVQNAEQFYRELARVDDRRNVVAPGTSFRSGRR